MITLSEVYEKNYLQLPRIERADVKLLWADGYWDGPLSGVLLYQGREYWFQMILDLVDDEFVDYRKYAIVELTDDQLGEEEYWHNLFREMVADYSDENGHLGTGVKPQETWDTYYEARAEAKPREYSTNPVIGWFQG